jgi:hypothetical protein
LARLSASSSSSPNSADEILQAQASEGEDCRFEQFALYGLRVRAQSSQHDDGGFEIEWTW